MFSALKLGIIFFKQCVGIALHLEKLRTMTADEQYTFRGSRILILQSLLILTEVKQTCHLRIYSSKNHNSWVSDIMPQQNCWRDSRLVEMLLSYRKCVRKGQKVIPFFFSNLWPSTQLQRHSQAHKKVQKGSINYEDRNLVASSGSIYKNTTNTRAETHVLYGIKCSIQL